MATAQTTKAETTLQDEIKKLELQLAEKTALLNKQQSDKINTLVQNFLAEIEKNGFDRVAVRKQCLKSSRVSTRHASKFSFSCSKRSLWLLFCWLYEPTTHHSHCEAVLALLVLAPGRLLTREALHFLCLMVPGCTRQSLLCRLYMNIEKKPKLLIYKAFRVDTYHVLIGIPIITCDRYLITQLSKLSLNLLTSQIFLLSFVIVELSALICIPVKFELSTAQITNQRRKNGFRKTNYWYRNWRS